jgi:hypothetical protein
MIYFNEHFLTIHWDEAHKCVVMEWKAFAKSAEFRRGLDKGLELLTNKKAARWLADMRKMGTIGVEDQKWSNEDWFPRAVRGGIRYMALVMPASALASMGVKNIMNTIGNIPIETQYFDSPDKARDWLKTRPA